MSKLESSGKGCGVKQVSVCTSLIAVGGGGGRGVNLGANKYLMAVYSIIQGNC